MKNLYMLVGLPGCGKSTFIDHMFRGPGITILSTDNYIEMIANKIGKTYNDVFKDNIKDAEVSLNNYLSTAIQYGDDIVWDQTNITVKTRAKKLGQIPSYYKKIAIVFLCADEAEHARRLASRPGKTIPEHILKNMKETFQMPTKEEGFDQIYIINT